MLRTDDFQKSQIVLEAWRQTIEYGGHLAACMVIGCLMNRVRKGWGSPLEVVKNVYKFSAELELPNRSEYPLIWDANFMRLLHEIDTQYDGSGTDYSKGGLYWCDLRRVDNPWFKANVLNGDCMKVADMNSFAVYK